MIPEPARDNSPDRTGEAVPVVFGSVRELARAMRRAEAAHAEHERRTGVPDPDWPDWYARYMAAELNGSELPE